MHQFLVVFEEAIPSGVKERAETAFSAEGVFPLSENALLVRTATENPQALSDVFGLADDEGAAHVGVIFRLNGSYYGHYYESLWDWLKKAREVRA